MVLAFILMKIYRRYRLQHYEIPARDVRKGHRWYMVDMFHEQTYCSISHDRIKHGARCDSCGLCVDDDKRNIYYIMVNCLVSSGDGLLVLILSRVYMEISYWLLSYDHRPHTDHMSHSVLHV
jgi:hypothetical protein